MKKMAILRAFLAIVVLAAIGASIAWKLKDNKTVLAEKAQQAQIRNATIPVIATQAGMASFDNSFEVYGTFHAFRELAFSAEVPGPLVRLNVDNGDVVREGQVLAEQDSELLQNELSMARLQLAQAERDLDRYRNSLQSGGVTQQQVDQAQLNVDAQKSRIKALQKQISQTTLEAPMAGTISGRAVERGSYVNPGMRLFDIINTEKLRFRAYLTSAQIVQVKIGEMIELIPDQFSQAYRGRISFIDVKPDAANNYLVEILIDNPRQGGLRPGMKATAKFSGGQQVNTLAIPVSSLVGSLRDARVYVLDRQDEVAPGAPLAGYARLRSITTGLIQDSLVQVLNGLDAGTWIITAGQINLEDGTAVQADAKK